MRKLFIVILFCCSNLGIQAGVQTATVTVTITTVDSGMAGADGSRYSTFAASVTGGAGTPTGSVVFSVNGQDKPAVTLSNGKAEFGLSLDAGDYTVVAKYSGDTAYAAANGSGTLSLPKLSMFMSILSAQPAVYGADAYITYYVVRRIIGQTHHPGVGAVSVQVDGVQRTDVRFTDYFTVIVPKPSVGSHTILITLSGNQNYHPASAGTTFFVNKGSATATLTASRTSVVYGQGVDFTATFTAVAPSPGPPTGTVTFQINGTDQATVNLVNGVAAFSATNFQPGTHYVRAIYNGGQKFNPSYSPEVRLNATCGVILSSPGREFTELGGADTINITATRECTWEVSFSVMWISVSSRTSSSLSYTVTPMTTGTERSGTITIDGISFKVFQKRTSAPVSGATFATGGVSADQIVSSFGAGLADTPQPAASLPLPTALGGVEVKVKDKLGVERPAPLFYVSSTQVNYLIPTGTAVGDATITFHRNGQAVSSSSAQVKAFSPGIFAANQNGAGAAAALIQRIKPSGSVVYEGTAQYDSGQQAFVTRPVSLGDGTELTYLLLFATGLRGIGPSNVVTATVGAVPVQVSYAGPQGQYAGLDQINLRLPFTLAGNGLADVKVYIDGAALNTTQVKIQ